MHIYIMKKIYLLSLLFITSLTSGCLEVVEEISLKQDGSGNYNMTIDLEKIKDGSLGLLPFGKDDNGSKDLASDVLTEKGLDLDSIKISLSKHPGIKNSYFRTEGTKFMWGYDFDHVDNMKGNAASDAIEKGSGLDPGRFALERADKRHYWFVKRRTLEAPAVRTQGENLLAGIGKFFLKGGQYTTIYHLPCKIKAVDNPRAVLSDRKRTLTLTLDTNDLIDHPDSQDLRMKFKRKKKYREPW